jgi:hypothetical protein
LPCTRGSRGRRGRAANRACRGSAEGDWRGHEFRRRSEPAFAEDQLALAEVRPVDQKHLDLRAVEEAGRQVRGLQRIVIEESLDIEVVDREVGPGLHGARQETGRGDIGDAFEDDVLIVVGEAANPAVGPVEAPAGGQRRHLAIDVGSERRGDSLHLGVRP